MEKKEILIVCNALKEAIDSASAEEKKVLFKFCPELRKAQTDVRDRVKTFEDALEELGIEAPQIIGGTPTMETYMKLEIITEALNGKGWKPKDDDKVWEVWLWGGNSYDGSGCGPSFSHSSYVWSYSFSSFSARLLFKSKELCDYAREQFFELYKKLYKF